MDKMNFSYNWNNKLDCHAFTTLRICNPSKHIVGNKVEIILKDKVIGPGTIMAVNRFHLDKINPFISYLDTGYSVDECKKIIRTMYPKVDFLKCQLALILIVKDKPVKAVEKKEPDSLIDQYKASEIV